MGVGKQAGGAGNWIDRYEDAPLILFDERGVGRIGFSCEGARAFCSPAPVAFSIVPRSI